MQVSLTRRLFTASALIATGVLAIAIGNRFVGADDGTSDTVDEAFAKLVCAPSPVICSTDDLRSITIRVDDTVANPDHLVNLVFNGRANVAATGRKVSDEVIIRAAIADVVYRLAILHEASTKDFVVTTEEAIAEIEANNALLSDPSAGTLVPALGFDLESMMQSSLEPDAVETYRTGMVISRFVDEYVTPLAPNAPLEARRLWMVDVIDELAISIEGYDVAIDDLPTILATPLFLSP